jgi:hypothetical protein
MNLWMHLLTTYTRHSKLQVITVISTIYKSPQHPLKFPACCVFTSRSLTMASNSGDSSAPRTHVLSSQFPLQNSCLNWQLPGCRPFHTKLLVFSSQADVQTTLCQLTTNKCQSQSQSFVTTDGQSTSLSWCQAPIWGVRPNIYCCQTVAGLFMWGVLSDERTGLTFTSAAGPCQHSHSWVRVPRGSWPYFTRPSCLQDDSSARTTQKIPFPAVSLLL